MAMQKINPGRQPNKTLVAPVVANLNGSETSPNNDHGQPSTPGAPTFYTPSVSKNPVTGGKK